jgi:hypothetical protein
MTAFSERYGVSDGESIITLGPPGTGKSHFLGSICEVVDPKRVLLLCPKPREKTSALYKKYGLTERAEVYTDLAGWNPERGKYEATAWRRLYDRVDGLLSDTSYDAILLDPFTDAVTLLEHHILAPFKVASPGELPNTQAFYRQLADKSYEFIQRATALADSSVAASPKFVMVAMHVQPPKEAVTLAKSQGGGIKESSDQLAEGIEYEGKVLPQMEGSYRRRIAGDFGLVVYGDVKNGKRMNPATKQMEAFTDFRIQVRCSEERHAKMAPIVAEAVPEMLPNKFSEIFKYLQAGASASA